MNKLLYYDWFFLILHLWMFLNTNSPTNTNRKSELYITNKKWINDKLIQTILFLWPNHLFITQYLFKHPFYYICIILSTFPVRMVLHFIYLYIKLYFDFGIYFNKHYILIVIVNKILFCLAKQNWTKNCIKL